MSVYCVNCLYLDRTYRYTDDRDTPQHYNEICDAPKNKVSDHKTGKIKPLAKPKAINKFNNCPWYVSKEYDEEEAWTECELRFRWIWDALGLK